MTPPNVLFVSTHDINPHLGAYAGVHPGAEYADTPNLDRLAAEGVRFDNAYAVAPICAPSRSSIMTGCFPTAIGTMHMRTKAVPPPEVRLLSEYFREAGYFTTNASFTDFQVPTPLSAFDECGEMAHWRNRPEGAPFFAAFHGMTTHESQIYLDDETFLARTPHVRHRHDPALAPLPPYHPDTEAFRIAWARYSDLITEMDHWVGGLLAELDDAGVADDTIVVFWSDHGAGMPRAKRWATEAGLHEPLLVRWPGHLAPGTVDEDLVHLMDLAPSLLAACGLEVPSHMHGRPFLTSEGSLVPQPNEYLFGARDRTGEARDRSRTVRDARFRYTRHMHPDRPPMQHTDYPDHVSTWRELRRLASAEAGQLARGELPTLLTPLQRTLVAPDKPAVELYDVVADPHEEHDLAGDSAYAAELDRLSDALDTWLHRFGDLADEPEESLLERWRPDGRWSRTEPPVGDRAGAASPTPGATVIWTTVPPRAPDEAASPPVDEIGAPVADGRRWRLLCEATPAPEDVDVWVRAVRLGYLDSTDVLLPARTIVRDGGRR